MEYRVRQGFYVHLGENNVASPGDILELRPDEFHRYAHQLEVVNEFCLKNYCQPLNPTDPTLRQTNIPMKADNNFGNGSVEPPKQDTKDGKSKV